MKPKIYATLPIPEEVKNYMNEYFEIRQWEGDTAVPRDILLKEVSDVEGIYTTGSCKIDEELLSNARNLKVISNVSVGYNNFDVETLKKHKVIGTNTPNVLDETVADLAFALILSTARRIAELDKIVKDGKWGSSRDEEYFGIDVHSTKIGIIGMGRIGEAIARRAKFGFNMDVLYYNRNRKPDAEEKYEAEYRDLESLLEESDFIVLMTPLTAETHHLIGEKEFKLMKKSAVFVNVSRGQTVDEQALIRALRNKEIYGAGLDVFQNEPTEVDNPLLTMNNVVTVPHIGSATTKTRNAMAMRAAKNLVSTLTGEGPIDPVY